MDLVYVFFGIWDEVLEFVCDYIKFYIYYLVMLFGWEEDGNRVVRFYFIEMNLEFRF